MNTETDHTLWLAFGMLFVVVAAAAVLPVEPIVYVFPAWSVVVLAAIVVTIAIALTAAATGWPEVSEA